MSDEGIKHISEVLREAIAEMLIEAANAEPFYDTGVDYKTYMRSPEWKARRDAFIEKRGDECNRCHLTGVGSRRIMGRGCEVHHRTYKHLGSEPDEDLEVLCNRCHHKVTNKEWTENMRTWWQAWGYNSEGILPEPKSEYDYYREMEEESY